MKEKFILKRVVIVVLLIVSVVALIYFGSGRSVNEKAKNITEVKEGSFKISVIASGELMAEKSIDLRGPLLPGNGSRRGQGRGRRIRAMSVKILDIVPEGTLVRPGDYVAQLDRTNYDNTLKDQIETLTTYEERSGDEKA